MWGWLGRVLGGGVVESVSDYGQSREGRKARQSEAWAAVRISAAAWLVWIAKAIGVCLVAYIVGCSWMMTTQYLGIMFGGKWAKDPVLARLWMEWRSVGAELFTFATAFLTIFAGGVAATDVTRNRAARAQGIAPGPTLVDRAKSLLPGSAKGEQQQAPPAQRAPLTPRPEGVERMPGIVAPERPRTNWFAPEEFECKGQTCGCDSPAMDAELMRILNEDVRAVFGMTIVNSGYRCPVHNAEVGGAPRTDKSLGSYHMRAKASDVRVPGVAPAQIYAYLDAKYPGRLGLGLYQRFVHIDVRPAPGARKASPLAMWRRQGVSPDIDLDQL